jgi:hypothetical protein
LVSQKVCDGRVPGLTPHDLGLFDFLVALHGVDQVPLFSPGAPITEQCVPLQTPG